MRKSSSCILKVFCLVLVCFVAMFALAQANRASVTGTVTDASHAVMPGVSVVVKNLDTNDVTRSVTNSDGIYLVPNLPPGRYSVQFEREGFQGVEIPDVRLTSTQVAQFNQELKVATALSTVTVSGEVPVLDQEVPTIGTNMKAEDVNNLPLSIYGGGRFVEEFAVAITPGYSPISSPYGAVVNGGQWFTKDFTVDGTSGTANIPGNSMQSGPTMEAVQEVQAETSGLDAQTSTTGGGVMAFSLKSGTNNFHGTGFLYGVNELLDANTWTNDSLGLPKAKQRAWDYGGSIGGPIIKNKTFFFGAIERYTQVDDRLGGYSSTVPTTDFMNGNFSALLGDVMCHDAKGALQFGASCGAGTTPIMVQDNSGATLQAREGMIFDPTTGNQFTGNMIPSNRISKVAQQVNSIYQKDYAPQSGSLIDNNRLPLSNSPTQTPIEAVAKIDQNFSQKDTMSGSWIYNHKPRTLVDSGGIWQSGTSDGGPLSAARLNFYESNEFRVSETHTFSPNLINVINYTYNWDKQEDAPASSGGYSSQLGFVGASAGNFPLISFGNDVNGRNVTFIGNTFQGDFSGLTAILGDTITWVHGRHSFNFGGQVLGHQVNSHAGSGALSFNFDNNTTGAASQDYANYVGFGYASFLLGDVSTAKETTPANLYGRQKTMALFAQDSWKVRSNLTINAGLRWDYNFRFHEKYGHWANFDTQQIDPTYGEPGKLVYASGGGDSFEKNEYAANFGPQIGFAYSPTSKLVLRASIGMVYMPPGVAYFNGVPDGFAPGFQGTNIVNSPFNWDSGYPGVYQPGTKATDPTFLFPVVTVDPRALKAGYMDQWNIGFQYETSRTSRVEVAYIGNRGHHLTDTSLAWNEGPSSQFLSLAKKYPDLNGFNHYVCSPADAAGYGIKYPYSGFCGPLISAIAPYPQLAQAMSNYWYYPNLLYVGLPVGQSYYDAVVFDFVKRQGNGLTYDMSYTISRQASDTFSAQQEGNGYYTAIQDFSNMGVAAKSLTGYDQTHVVKGFVNYQLPFGKGQRWLADSKSALNAVVGGWNVAALLLYYTGQPFEVSANNPYWPLWGNIYPNWNLPNSGPSNPGNYVPVTNPNAPIPASNFYLPGSVSTQPAPGTFGKGPLAISELRCPGEANENLSAMKNFTMGPDGRYQLQLRAEFYNVFNRHYYDIVGCAGTRATIGSSDFAQITGVADNPRTGQFAIRFQF